MKSKIFKHFLVFLMIVSLVVVIIAKAFFVSSPNLFLAIYGVSVTVVVLLLFVISRWYKDPSVEIREKGLNKKMKLPFISCILAVRNEEKIIPRCLDSFVKSNYPYKEVIVINDASTDNTKKVLSRYNKICNCVRIINLTKNVGKKRAIAEGLKIAKGEIFVFTDSDCVVEPDSISKIIEIFIAHEDVGAVSGHGRALNSTENLITKIQDSWYETQFSVKKAFESVYGAVTCVSGPLAVFRKSAIYNYIPAWENDSFLGQEFKFATDRQLTGYVLGSRHIGEELKRKYKDSEFLKENYPTKEWKIVYCKSAKVFTVVPNTFKKFIRQNIRWKKSFIRNLFFTGRFYWRKPIIPALKFYFGALFIILGPFIALRHLIYLPLTGNIFSAVYYLAGIVFIGSLYGVFYQIEDPESKLWIYRPLMSLLSTLIFSWLIFYAMFTIKKMAWHRG